MKKIVILMMFVLIASFILSGCISSPVVTNPGDKNNPMPSDGKAYVSIEFDWDDFDRPATLAFRTVETSAEITSVGALLIYVEENAFFAQSVSKNMAETNGVITLEVPPTRKANLFVAAVKDGPGLMSGEALYMGAMYDLTISNQSTSNITIQDFDLMKPVWHVGETHAEHYEEEKPFIGDKTKERFELPILVRDPFQVGQKLTRGKTVIKAAGHSRDGDNPDGWRRIYVSGENEKPNEVHTSEYWFHPYLDGTLFNLPKTYYYIGPNGEFTVNFE